MWDEYYGVASTPTDDYLAHYGVKGMKWGVRKAIATGNQRALDRHFRKAAKKLRKLQDIGLHSGKYAAKAAAYGVAAAGTGTIAVAGTPGLSKIASKLAKRHLKKAALAQAYLVDAQNSAADNAYNLARKYKKSWIRNEEAAKRAQEISNKVSDWGEKRRNITEKYVEENRYPNMGEAQYEVKTRTRNGMSNNSKLRIGAAVATVGLGAKAAQNAYRASHGAKYLDKAVRFKTAMDDAFSGTKYEGQYVALPKTKKRRRK